MPTKERDLTTGQAAAFLGVTAETIASYADRGRIEHYRLPSGHRRFRRADLEKHLPVGRHLVAVPCDNPDEHPLLEALPGSQVYCPRCKAWFIAGGAA